MSHLYGVFPTHGYKNDSRYPETYQVGEVVLDSAGCSLKNKVRQGIFTTAYGQHILLQLLCPPDLYDLSAPTKQNLLCNSRSPKHIVSTHHHHTYYSATNTNQTKIIPPSFRYVSHYTTRYVLVLDRSIKMDTSGRWTNLHNALFG